eukprot:1540532-Rhodomonas_salina.1
MPVPDLPKGLVRYSPSVWCFCCCPTRELCSVRVSMVLRGVWYWPSVWCYAVSGTDLANGAVPAGDDAV